MFWDSRAILTNTALENRIAYVSFDAVPGPKGAATHIEAFARALTAAFGGLDLITISEEHRSEQCDGAIRRTTLPAVGVSLIDRVLCFRRFLTHWLETRSFEAIQFRSIFEGIPLLAYRGRTRLIFEVNGLPSVELKYRYPDVVDDRDVMRKIVSQEQACFEAADAIVTPGGVTRKYLVERRGVSPHKVHVVANGVDLNEFHPRPRNREAGIRLIYFGTLSSWQGVEIAIRAVAQVQPLAPATLSIVGPGSGRQRGALVALATKLGIRERIAVLPPVSRTELNLLLGDADAVLAPLALNDRNVVQGCCPLKVLEGMAAGLPVIASDLCAVRELGSDGVHFVLVKPGSVDQLAGAIVRLRSDRDLAMRIGRNARAHVAANYSWQRSGAALISIYQDLGICATHTAARPWDPPKPLVARG
jgi:glycosyltransferase involved in cell wall biosynthesis